ncbi:MAG: hypothetical protein Ta2G_12840 [Termitinemataceae bacterium]|nr:MAG: hypothetical protein Ta2G_12840 [Termitinemataceae bacterium]
MAKTRMVKEKDFIEQILDAEEVKCPRREEVLRS